MAKYQTKPTVVEAHQFDGTEACAKAILKPHELIYYGCSGYDGVISFWGETPSFASLRYAYKDDWIVRGENTLCSYSPEVFNKIYEPVLVP